MMILLVLDQTKLLIKRYWVFKIFQSTKKKRMKQVLGVIILVIFSMACGNNTNEGNASGVPLTEDAINKKGIELINNSDCLTCHNLNKKIIGPSLQDIAKKYENTEANVKMLAGKIKNGGSGNWGEIPMQAHASINQADAETIAKYILLLK